MNNKINIEINWMMAINFLILMVIKLLFGFEWAVLFALASIYVAQQ
jgi:hypothetical protein